MDLHVVVRNSTMGSILCTIYSVSTASKTMILKAWDFHQDPLARMWSIWLMGGYTGTATSENVCPIVLSHSGND